MQRPSQAQNQHRKAQKPIVLRIKTAFWLPIFIKFYCLFCWVTRTKPNHAVLKRAVDLAVKPAGLKASSEKAL